MKFTKFFSIIFLGLLLQASFEVYCYSIKESINNCKIKAVNAIQKLKENKKKFIAAATFFSICGIGLWEQRRLSYKKLTLLHKLMMSPLFGIDRICIELMELYYAKISDEPFRNRIPGEPL